jgi:hypothetical protein
MKIKRLIINSKSVRQRKGKREKKDEVWGKVRGGIIKAQKVRGIERMKEECRAPYSWSEGHELP